MGSGTIFWAAARIRPARGADRRSDIVATITDPFGESQYRVRAPHDGYVIGLNN